MDIRPITPATLAASVIAVPPVARDGQLRWNVAENVRLMRHIEAGGVTTLLYGGNAALAHVALSEFADLLQMLADNAAAKTIVIPSVGPTYGMMMDQASILRDFPFPTVMLLPSRDGTTPAGIATGLRHFVDRIERPAVLYLKQEEMVDARTVRRMIEDGLLSFIKYGIVRKDPRDDDYLKGLVDAAESTPIVSGMGEQPAIVHMRDFGLAGFTSGCVCVAPRLSMDMLNFIRAREFDAAERNRRQFAPMEELRDAIGPVRALHAAIAAGDIADTGPITPFFSPVSDGEQDALRAATRELLQRSDPSATSHR